MKKTNQNNRSLGNYYHIKLIFFCFIFNSLFVFSQNNHLEKAHYTNDEVKLFDKHIYTLSKFNEQEIKQLSDEAKRQLQYEGVDISQLGKDLHHYNKDAIEIISERNLYNSTYILPDGKRIFTSSSKPMNYYDEFGKLQVINYKLSPFSEGSIYHAKNQPIPKSIDFSNGKTEFKTPIGSISINQTNNLSFTNSHNEILSQNASYTNSSIGENGFFSSNVFPSIDMQVILMNNGSVKTNYILKDKNNIPSNSDYLVIEDIINLPLGTTIDYSPENGINNGNGNDWEGKLVFKDESGEDVFIYAIPFIYDDHYTKSMMNITTASYNETSSTIVEEGVDSDAFTFGAYDVIPLGNGQFKILVKVKTDWLLMEERQFPVVIDPVTFTGNTLTFTAGNFCARRVSGTMPVDNPGPTGVGCHTTTTVLPAGYMLIATQPVRVWSGYETRGCAASSTWIKYYGPCGMYPRESGFFYFCNTNLTNINCGAPGAGHSMDGILSRCATSAGEDCIAASAPSCSPQTLTFSACYQTRCFSGGAGNCAQTSSSSSSYVEAGVSDFKVDIIGEKITSTLSGGGNVCPNSTNTLTLGTRFGVPKSLNTANCSDQMGGTYSWTATSTGGTLSSTSGITNTTGGFASAITWTAPATAGTYTVTVTVCNTDCATPAGTMCDVRTVTYTVGDAIAPIVSDPLFACSGQSVTNTITNNEGYTYTWYTDATGTSGAANGTSRTYPSQPDGTYTYSVRATAPCNSSLVTFDVTWGPVQDPIVNDGGACPGEPGSITANCGSNCNWYNVSSGGTALTSGGGLTVSGGTLSIDAVTTSTTYYVEYNGGAGCISNRVPVTMTTNGITVTPSPSSFDPLCAPSTGNITTTISGNTDYAPVMATNTGTNAIENAGNCTGPDCTTANSGLLTVTAPAGIDNPMNNNSIASICFDMPSGWCGKQVRIYLKSPAGTIFTLFGGREKGIADTPAGTMCYSDNASGTLPAPTNGPAIEMPYGTYLADGGNINATFAGEDPTGTWTIMITDNIDENGQGQNKCDVGGNLTNFEIGFNKFTAPAYSWAGGTGSLSSTTISNPVFTPPAGNYNTTWTVTVTDATGCTGVGTVTGVCTTLPIDLIDLYGVIHDNHNQIVWTTAQEKNIDYYEILRSTDNENFQAIGQTLSVGNSHEQLTYKFIDKTRNNGSNYYKLVAVDLDGTRKEHGPILLNTNSTPSILSLLPNPTNGVIYAHINANNNTVANLGVYDSKGNLIEQIETAVQNGKNSIFIDSQNLANGVYLVKVVIDDKIETKRFVKY